MIVPQMAQFETCQFLSKMSTPIQVSTAAVEQASESLREATNRLNAFIQGTLTLPPGVTFQDLKEEVARCSAEVAGAQETLAQLAKQEEFMRGFSHFWIQRRPNSFADIKSEMEKITQQILQEVVLEEEHKNNFNDSMTGMGAENNIVKLKSPRVDGQPELLYSDEILVAEKKLGIIMPVEKIL